MKFKVNTKGLYPSILKRQVITWVVIGTVFWGIDFFSNSSLDRYSHPLNILILYLWISLFSALITMLFTLSIKTSYIEIENDILYSRTTYGLSRSIPLKNIHYIYKHGFFVNNITVKSGSFFNTYNPIIIYERTENLKQLLEMIRTKARPNVRRDIDKNIL